MEKNVKIDFLRQKYRLDASKRKPFVVFGRILLTLTIFASISGMAFSYNVSDSSEASGASFPRLSLFSTLRRLVGAGDRKLLGEEDDRVNFLLMGVGGEGHDGPQLADTIILASWQPSTDNVGMISLPRDLAVPIPGYGLRKINHANAFGEMKEPGSGPLLASQVVEDITKQSVNYYIRVDFRGFAQLIDDIGGVDIYVDRSFTDSQYPILGNEEKDCGTTTTIVVPDESEGAEPGSVTEQSVPTYGCRYEDLSFQEGWTKMNGDTALKYVRSRKGSNGEGTDFARSRRQQKVLAAVKEKVFSSSTILNPSRLGDILDTLQENIATNLGTWELMRLASEFKNLDTNKIVNHVLDASTTSPLYATSLNGAYVLMPKNDDWGAVVQLATNIYTTGTTTTQAIANGTTTTPEEKPKFVRIEVQNGTTITGLAFRASQILEGQGYDVVKIGNAVERGYEHTVIYDLTNGANPDELKALKEELQADVTLSASGWLVTGDIIPKEITISPDEYAALATSDQIDFLVILGQNSTNVVRN